MKKQSQEKVMNMEKFIENAINILENKDRWVTKKIEIDASDMTELEYEDFLDLISEKAVGHCCLEDISYRVVGHKRNNIIILKVTGEDNYDKDEEDQEELANLILKQKPNVFIVRNKTYWGNWSVVVQGTDYILENSKTKKSAIKCCDENKLAIVEATKKNIKKFK